MAKEWQLALCRTHVQSGVPGTYPAPVSVPVVMDTGELAKMEGPSIIGVITNKSKVTYMWPTNPTLGGTHLMTR